ncbi:hypothetical protein [Cupriavidus sp. DL-D2]|uniref:hypothetical protein n=1 Tax=Cupriavidus sp. DL-D2 TaxID=3144974 RepID=UPI00321224B1
MSYLLPDNFEAHDVFVAIDRVEEQLREMRQNTPGHREEAKRRILLEAVDKATTVDQLRVVLRYMLGESY